MGAKSLGALLAALLLTICACSGGSESGSKGSETGAISEKTSGDSIAVEVNSPAPAFAAKVMGGGELRLADHVGKVVLLEFWSIFCKSCLEEMPSVKELHRRYRDKGFEVISVNTDAFSDSRVMQVLNKAGISFDYPVVRDTRREVSEAYNVQLLPVTVIIDRSGWIRLYQEGYRAGEEERFADVIKKYLDRSAEADVTLAPRGGVTSFAPAGTRMGQGLPKLAAPVTREALSGGAVAIGGGKPALLFFWSLYCQPCREEFPLIDKLAGELRAKGQELIAVNVDSPRLAPRALEFLAAYPGVKCVNDLDEAAGEALSDLLDVGATPTIVAIDSKGAATGVLRGAADTAGVAGLVKSLR